MKYITRSLEKVVMEVTQEYPRSFSDGSAPGGKNHYAPKTDGRDRTRLCLSG